MSSLTVSLTFVFWISPKPGYAEGIVTFAPATAAAIMLGLLLARPRPAAAGAARA